MAVAERWPLLVGEDTTPNLESDADDWKDAVPPPPINSRFLFVNVAGRRARQLRRGAKPRVQLEGVQKAERLAMEEVRQRLVPYELAF